jgi:LPXTG-motif cell wall-anchored protein
MRSLIIPTALLLALSVPALAQKGTIGDKPPSSGGDKPPSSGGDKPPSSGVKGAPGPLVGAGLPALLIGGGIYWLVRRRKGQARTP